MQEIVYREDEFVLVTYDTARRMFVYSTNARDPHMLILSYLLTRYADGDVDDRVPNSVPTYHVRLGICLDSNTYRVTSNTGNTTVATGILAMCSADWDSGVCVAVLPVEPNTG